MNFVLPGIEYRSLIEEEITSLLNKYTSPLYTMLKYHMGWVDAQGISTEKKSGKLLRPTLCCITCKAVGGDIEKALPAASALELVHNFSLIHDDIQDNDEERHHKPTVWKVWGVGQAINAGNVMRTLAGKAIFQALDRGLESDRVMKLTEIIDDASIQLIEGQYLDIDFEKSDSVPVDLYLEMIEGKTASLIAASMECGAVAGGASREISDRTAQAGFHMGKSFQLKDDVLGIWGDENVTGKKRGNDILRNKISAPLLYFFQHGDDTLTEEYSSILSQDNITTEKMNRLIELVEESGAKTWTEERAMEEYNSAQTILQNLPFEKESLSHLVSVAQFFINRTY